MQVNKLKMKTTCALSAIVLLVCSLTGCCPVSEQNTPLDSVKTYRDIPGVTDEEIAAIEKLKNGRDKFAYGALLSIEAYVLPDGSYAGYGVEFCKLLSQLFGVSFELEIYEWDELIEKLDSGGIDFTGELTQTEERAQIYIMSGSIAERMLRIFKHAGSDTIKTEVDVYGRRIGFLKDSQTARSIGRKAYPSTFIRVDVENYPAAAKMIENGEIDAFVGESVADTAFIEYDFISSSVFFPMVYTPVSLVVADTELSPIISVLDKYLAAGGADALDTLYRECEFNYARQKFNKLLTYEERAYIDDLARRDGSIVMIYEHDNYPVSFYNDKDREFQGIAVDVLNEIGRISGIKFEPSDQKDTTFAEIYEKLVAKEIPMVAQLLISEVRGDSFLWSTIPYGSSKYALISRLDHPKLSAYQVARATVGAMKGSGKIDVYRALFPENDNIVEYDTQHDCLDALERGEIDLMMAAEYNLLMQTNYREKSGFKINILLNLPMNSHFGFHNGETVLRSIIDKAQRFVQTNEIEVKWTGRSFDYTKKFAEERVRYLTIYLAIMFFVLMLIAFMLIKNIRLGKALEKMANHDALTGIFNRRYFMEQAIIQNGRSLRLEKESFIVLYDFDYFKSVNDTRGHLAGDMVLRKITQNVKGIIRPHDLFGRYGGEEFIILMCDTDKENVVNATERIRQIICGTPVEYNGMSISVAASFGIAHAAPTKDLTAAINAADEALYRAKNEGRNRIVFSET